MAHIYKYRKETVLTVKEGLAIIKANRPIKKVKVRQGWEGEKTIKVAPAYTWVVVENNKGDRFELGGRMTNTDHLEIKAYIPKYEKGEPVKYHFNDMCDHHYAIDFDERTKETSIDYPTQYVRKKLFNSVDAFVNHINNRDWVNNPIELLTETILVEKEVEFINVKL